MLFRFFFCYWTFWALPANGRGTPTRGKLELESMLVGEPVQIRLRAIDPNQFLLLNRGFVKVFTPDPGIGPRLRLHPNERTREAHGEGKYTDGGWAQDGDYPECRNRTIASR